ncbi:MAG TPA: hypothetical protein VFZ03_00660 [Dongiaceae bacterium]
MRVVERVLDLRADVGLLAKQHAAEYRAPFGPDRILPWLAPP